MIVKIRTGRYLNWPMRICSWKKRLHLCRNGYKLKTNRVQYRRQKYKSRMRLSSKSWSSLLLMKIRVCKIAIPSLNKSCRCCLVNTLWWNLIARLSRPKPGNFWSRKTRKFPRSKLNEASLPILNLLQKRKAARKWWGTQAPLTSKKLQTWSSNENQWSMLNNSYKGCI